MSEPGLELATLEAATRGLVTALSSGEAEALSQHWEERETSIERLKRLLRQGGHAISSDDRAAVQRIQELDRGLLTELDRGLQQTRAELDSIGAFRRSVRETETADVPRFLSYRA